jgi:hypothetical protein
MREWPRRADVSSALEERVSATFSQLEDRDDITLDGVEPREVASAC